MPDTRVVSLKGRIHQVGPALDLPDAKGLVYIGRSMYMGGWRLPASEWANPYRVQKVGGAARAVELYGQWLHAPEQAALLARVPELRGLTLACWCTPGNPCHGHVLAHLANHTPAPRRTAPTPNARVNA